jgi:hypothetical protein
VGEILEARLAPIYGAMQEFVEDLFDMSRTAELPWVSCISMWHFAIKKALFTGNIAFYSLDE